MNKQPPIDWCAIKANLVRFYGFHEVDFATMSMEMFWGYVEALTNLKSKAGKPSGMSHRDWIQQQMANVRPPQE